MKTISKLFNRMARYPVAGMTVALVCGLALVCALWVPETSLWMPDAVYHVCMVLLFLFSALYMFLLIRVILDCRGKRRLLLYGVFFSLAVSASLLAEPVLQAVYSRWANARIAAQARAGDPIAEMIVAIDGHELRLQRREDKTVPDRTEPPRLRGTSIWYWPHRLGFYSWVLTSDQYTPQERDAIILAYFRMRRLAEDKETRIEVDAALDDFRREHRPLMAGLSEQSLNAVSRAAAREKRRRAREAK